MIVLKSNPLSSILKVIVLKSNPIYGVTNNNGSIGKGTLFGTVLWEMLTKLFVRSYKLLIYFFLISFTLNHSSHIQYVHMRRLTIQNWLKCTGRFRFLSIRIGILYLTPGYTCIMIYRTVCLHADMCKR